MLWLRRRRGSSRRPSCSEAVACVLDADACVVMRAAHANLAAGAVGWPVRWSMSCSGGMGVAPMARESEAVNSRHPSSCNSACTTDNSTAYSFFFCPTWGCMVPPRKSAALNPSGAAISTMGSSRSSNSSLSARVMTACMSYMQVM